MAKIGASLEQRKRSNRWKETNRGGRLATRFRNLSQDKLDRVLRVKNLLSQLIHDWDDTSPAGFREWHKGFRLLSPPPIITISEWADTYRFISTEFAAEPGKWHTSKFEPMREVMDSCSPGSRYRRVVLVKPAQSGGSESCVLNVIGYTIDVNPRSMLVVFPTLDSCESFSKERLDPMVAVTPALSNKVVEVGRVKKGVFTSTVKKKKYPGGFLNMVGANSTTGLSSRPVPIVIVDEVDLCIKNANRQGNPVKLALSRTTTFFDRKEILLSSPSNDEGESGIIPFWEDGSQARLERCCPNPNCATFQVLDFDRMEVDSAMLCCEKCGNYFPQWKWHLSGFRWQHANVEHPTTASYWISGLDSPWIDWKVDLCEDYVICKRLADIGDDSLLRVFVNSKLAKQYKRKGKRVDVDLYHDRREIYDCHASGAEVPDGVILITAGVDVQDSFISYDVTGWGKGRESWGIETGEFQGDPRIPDSEVWKQLDQFVYNRIWRYADGNYIRTRLLFIDSQGHCTDDVYKYCKSRHPRVLAIKGIGGQGQPIIMGGRVKRRQKVVEGVWLIKLGVDTLKDEFHSRLSIVKVGPGYCHWPMQPNGMPACGYTLEYFEEIISEQRELTYNKSGFAEYRWTKNRTDPNEALDCRNYARAALEYLRIRLEQMSRDVVVLLPQDVERVEVGTDRFIYVQKSDIKTRHRAGYSRYGSGEQEQSQQPPTRGTTQFGAGGETSF
jgi:phage terminase large subunit GpA-like protein